VEALRNRYRAPRSKGSLDSLRPVSPRGWPPEAAGGCRSAGSLGLGRRSTDAFIAGGLDSDEARTFLEAMPTAEQLLPAPSVAEIDAASAAEPRRSRYDDY